jgi:hypothetical protein
MADLLSQNIGTNYKSILNLDATTINTPLDATLRAVTDGMGTSSPLQLSTGQVGISRTVALSAGATNPRLFNEVYTINNSGAQTGTLTGIFLNATETALNGMSHNLMDLQVGGVSGFKILNNFNINIGGSFTNLARVHVRGDGINTIARFENNAGTFGFRFTPLATVFEPLDDANHSIGSQFKMLNTIWTNVLQSQYSLQFTALTGLYKFNGTTSSFPAIKRNGAAIDFRLADDSAYCNIKAANLTASIILNNLYYDATGTLPWLLVSSTTAECNFKRSSLFSDATGTAGASAQLQIDSTTKGFLPPRMTTAQVNAIVTPAEGLVVFNTTISHLCVYQAAAWVKINHSPM